jgi:metal-sulfur cluster biosynthetic enzyme
MVDHNEQDDEPIVGDVMPAGEIVASAEPPVSEDQVRAVLRKVKDPDLNLNIVDLGLIYGVRVDGPKVNVDITLTSPGCPSGPEIMGNAEQMIRALPGVGDVQMNLVWAPFWTPDRIEPRVRAYLGL